MSSTLRFSPTAFFYGLLPPIVFAAGALGGPPDPALSGAGTRLSAGGACTCPGRLLGDCRQQPPQSRLLLLAERLPSLRLPARCQTARLG
jgi:hypothetical protein